MTSIFRISIALLLFVFCTKLAKAQLIEDFSEETITSAINRPVGIRFDENGQAYVWDRKGIIHTIDSSGTLNNSPLLDISEEVGAWGDHGLLGLALDPDYLNNGYFYLSYVVDRHYLLFFGTNQYNPDTTIANQATIGRITRYQADPATNFTTIVPGSRKVLLGETKETGFPILIASHGVGSLAFGTDGTLLASCGEAGSFLSDDFGSDPQTYFQQALDDGIIREKDNVGSYRSQMIDNLNGKIIRIDPGTGDGLPSNPFYDPADPRAARSRVYTLGLRNPFRFIVKPNTGSHNPADGYPGTLYIGDVGGSKWEELNVCDQAAMNFGFPLYEGIFEKPVFWQTDRINPDAENPLYSQGLCDRQFYDFQDLIQQPLQNQLNIFKDPCDPELEINPDLTFIHTLPTIMYANKLSNLPARAFIPTFTDGEVDSINIENPSSSAQGDAFSGYSSIAGLFYEGNNFPEEFKGKYFHADYSWWIRTMDFDENNALASVESFHENSAYILDMAEHPINGCIYYVGFQAKVKRICFGGNNPPVAKLQFDQQYGPGPLTVNFDASGSYDPEGTPLSYFWDFGDGQSSNSISPSHTFIAPDQSPLGYDVILTVVDSLGAQSSESITISVNNTPPQVSISSFTDGDFYSINGYSILPLEAEVIDMEHQDAELTYAWTTILKHNTHEHVEEPVYQTTTTTLIEPLGCDSEEEYWYEIQLEVKDAAGLIGRDTNELFPYCGDPIYILKEWNGMAEESQIRLTWETESEFDLTDFELQKINPQGGVQTLAHISPSGSGSTYVYIDEAPLIGYNIYRLKIHQASGIFDFTPQLRIVFPAIPEIKVYPNPGSDHLVFEMLEPGESMEIEIFDATGALVWNSQHTIHPIKINLSGLAAGTYTYRLHSGQQSYTGKWIKLP